MIKESEGKALLEGSALVRSVSEAWVAQVERDLQLDAVSFGEASAGPWLGVLACGG